MGKKQSSGLTLMLMVSLMFAGMGMSVKYAGRLPPLQLVFARVIITLCFSFTILKARKIPVLGNKSKRVLLVLRGVWGTAGLSAFFFALTKIPYAEATIIQYTNPVLTALLAAFFLREHLTWPVGAAFILCTLGIIVIALGQQRADATTANVSNVYFFVAALGALFSAAAYVTVRKLTQTEDPHVIVFFFPLVAFPVLCPIVLRGWVSPTPFEWFHMALLGVFAQAGQIFLTFALKVERAGKAMIGGYIQIALAAFLGLVCFGEIPTFLTGIGACFIVFGTFVSSREKAIE